MSRALKIVLAAVLIVLISASAFAAGGKIRGGKGIGAVHQVQVRNSDVGTPAF